MKEKRSKPRYNNDHDATQDSQNTELDRVFGNLQRYFLGDASETYSDKVMELAYEPNNVGEMDNPDGTGYARGECGDSMWIFLKYVNNQIIDATFLSDGCGATLAVGSAVTELAKIKSKFKASRISPQDIIHYLNGLPASHYHCATLAVQALNKALEDLDDI